MTSGMQRAIDGDADPASLQLDAGRSSASVIPRPPTGWTRVARAAASFGDLFYIQFSSIRTGWQWYFLVGSALPLALLMFLKFVVPSGHPATLLYYVTGNVVVSLSLNPLFMLSGQLSWARQSKAFDFYAGLPISRTALILASVAISVLFTLPGMILLLILGTLIFHLALVPNALVAVVLLVSPIALSGLGAMIGVLAPNQQVSGVIANLTAVTIMFLSPIFVPPSKLPGVLQITSHLLPPTYAADALRQTLTGRVTPRLGVDLLVLALFSIASIYIVTARLDWRSR